jgi:hypothetical protein
MARHKCVLSLHLARYLLAQGFRIVDIEKSRKHRNRLVFLFEESDALQQAILNYWKGDSAATNDATNYPQPISADSQNQ